MVLQGDHVAKDLGATETIETELGTITIPATGVSKIVGIAASIAIQTATAGEGTHGEVRLAFKTVSGSFVFPVDIIYGPAGTLADSGHSYKPTILPVEIPVPPNETITVYAALDLAQTGTCHGHVFLLME